MSSVETSVLAVSIREMGRHPDCCGSLWLGEPQEAILPSFTGRQLQQRCLIGIKFP